MFSLIGIGPGTAPLVIGFDSGIQRGHHADIGENLLLNNQTLSTVNLYRIDGRYIAIITLWARGCGASMAL